MADRTGIEWTDATWNPVRGCSRVSAGCQHCYAERVAARFSGAGQPYEGLIHPTTRGWNGEVRLVPEALRIPWRWSRGRRIFVNSMSDLFHPAVPFEFVAAVFWVMAHTTRHTYQILTKRPERIIEFFWWAMEQHDEELGYEPGESDFLFPEGHELRGGCMDNGISYAANKHPAIKALGWEPWRKGRRGGYDNCGPGWPYENVWLGVSVEDQAAADERIPLLLQCPAAVRWVSAEPLLGPMDLYGGDPDPRLGGVEAGPGLSLEPWWRHDDSPSAPPRAHVNWVVAGGESGSGARPMHPDWARSLRDQCAAAGVPFLFKQWGGWANADAAGLDLNACYDGSHQRGGWVEVDGANTIGEVAAPQRADASHVFNLPKKATGRLLDGVLHDAYPEARR